MTAGPAVECFNTTSCEWQGGVCVCRGGAFLFRAAAGISQLELLLLRCQGGWEDDARGSQALPAKPLTKGIILGEGEQPPLPRSSPRPEPVGFC